MVANLVQSLGSALVYPDAGNFDTNRKLWDNYAAEWEPSARCFSFKSVCNSCIQDWYCSVHCLPSHPEKWKQFIEDTTSNVEY